MAEAGYICCVKLAAKTTLNLTANLASVKDQCWYAVQESDTTMLMLV